MLGLIRIGESSAMWDQPTPLSKMNNIMYSLESGSLKLIVVLVLLKRDVTKEEDRNLQRMSWKSHQYCFAKKDES